jgi:hypothetical protein
MSLTYKLNNQHAGAKLTRIETEYSKFAAQYQAEYNTIVENVNSLKTNMVAEKTEVLAAIAAYKEIIGKFEDSKKRAGNVIKVNKNTNSNLAKKSRENIKAFYGEFLGYKTEYETTKNLLNTRHVSLTKILDDANIQLKNLTGETFAITDKGNGSKEKIINNTVKWRKENGSNIERDQYLKGKILTAMTKKANSLGSKLLSEVETTKGELADSYIDLWESQWFDGDGNGSNELNLETAIPVLDAKWNEVGNYLKETILTAFFGYYRDIISKKQKSFQDLLNDFKTEIAAVKNNGNMSNVNIDKIAGFFVTMESENELLKSYFAELNSIFTKNKNTFYNNGTSNPNTNNFRKKTSANAPNQFYADLITNIDELNTKMSDLDNQMSEGKNKFIESTTKYKLDLAGKFTAVKDGLISTLNGCMKKATENLEANGTKKVIEKLAKLSAKVILDNPRKILGNNVSNSVKSINNATKEQQSKFTTTLTNLSTGLAEIGKIVPTVVPSGQKSNSSNSVVSPGAVGNNGKNWRNNVLAKFPVGSNVTYKSATGNPMTGKMGNKENTRTGKKAIKIISNSGKNNSMLLNSNNVSKKGLELKA